MPAPMCGVIGLVNERVRADMGKVAAELLQTLEYRGYDSTGAAIQGDDQAVDLRKDVGAPSKMAAELGIVDLAGRVLCGQVRWATFGAVDQLNAQPHLVSCKTQIYGAHNGNVTNCDGLKEELSHAGHRVLSDNDGEMVVHSVEHAFADELALLSDSVRQAHWARRAAMRRAIVTARKQLDGSYAAVVVDPVTHTAYAIKAGSSLYFGVGEAEEGGHFGIASSDLSSVLKLTRVLIPLLEGEAVEFDGPNYEVFSVADGRVITKTPIRSRLRAQDTGLVPPFDTFMDQEIHAQVATSREVIQTFAGGSAASREVAPILDGLADDERQDLEERVDHLLDQYSDEAIARSYSGLLAAPTFRTVMGRLPQEFRARVADGASELASSERGFLIDLIGMTDDSEGDLAVAFLDAMVQRREGVEFAKAVGVFCQRMIDSIDRGGRVFIVCCGTSFHAAKAACLFFNELASTEVLALLPGEFRGQYAQTVRDGDLFIAVSQSGETKDLIDVMNGILASGVDIGRIAIVNNVNSTLGQEKAELVIPLRCGPEIAVPATKSFINQLTVFYCLAVRLAERRLTTGHVIPGQAETAELSRRNLELPALPTLIQRTIEETAEAIDEAAHLLYLAPSMHLLATRLLAVAREGALKVREVVLNHTEGFEASEFKHGPNTILGVNTVFGPREVQALLHALGAELKNHDDVEAACRSLFVPGESPLPRPDLFDTMRSDYPLVYITGPDDRDVSLTVSQMNTHKIRGASTVVVAEEDDRLRQAAEKPPADNADYKSVYVVLPSTGDTLMTTFSATVALQRLALKMSVKKMNYLDGLGFRGHGVHPDVPKNVSKSITVD